MIQYLRCADAGDAADDADLMAFDHTIDGCFQVTADIGKMIGDHLHHCMYLVKTLYFNNYSTDRKKNTE